MEELDVDVTTEQPMDEKIQIEQPAAADTIVETAVNGSSLTKEQNEEWKRKEGEGFVAHLLRVLEYGGYSHLSIPHRLLLLRLLMDEIADSNCFRYVGLLQ